MHYFSSDPTVESAEHLLHFTVSGRSFSLLSDRGIFSKDALDSGTKVLLETLIERWSDPAFRAGESCTESAAGSIGEAPQPAGDLLDLGCGNGTIALVLTQFFPALKPHLYDVNRRALGLARKNLASYGLDPDAVEESNGLAAAADQKFDYIVTNPPIRTGKETLHRLYREAFDHLKMGGRLYLVVGKKQGAASTQRFLAELFGNCERLSRDRGFWILACVKAADQSPNQPASRKDVIL